MGFDLGIFGEGGIDKEFLEWLVDERSIRISSHFGRLWDYYGNRMIEVNYAGGGENGSETGRLYVQAQEYGLPARITGLAGGGGTLAARRSVRDIQRKEVVIENDIAWRINAAVDFLFGKGVTLVSKSPDAKRRVEIEAILKAVFSANGGVGFFQDMAVLGGVYGFVDCFVRAGEGLLAHPNSSGSTALRLEAVLESARSIGLELIEAPRALPVLEEDDYRRISFYVQHFYQKRNRLVAGGGGFLSRLMGAGKGDSDTRETVAVTEIVSADAWQRYEDKELVAEGQLPWGFLPVVHIQNIAQPYYYEGISDVEPLVPLQDELNTRLSDRASRITFQAFKMYLGKGIEGFEDRPIAPGRMWCTDNMDATIEEFGGDRAAPSEDMHIAEIREAMDKVSGVTPLVAGVIKSKLGNLTSAVALRLTLMGMLSKTDRKRFTYGEGIKRICSMVLAMLDKAGIYRSDYDERDIEIIFPSPLPENTMEKLDEALMKKELGVSSEQILRELGYEMKS